VKKQILSINSIYLLPYAASNLLLEGGPWSSRRAGSEGGEMGVGQTRLKTAAKRNLGKAVRPMALSKAITPKENS
jgi:hypothetical protein